MKMQTHEHHSLNQISGGISMKHVLGRASRISCLRKFSRRKKLDSVSSWADSYTHEQLVHGISEDNYGIAYVGMKLRKKNDRTTLVCGLCKREFVIDYCLSCGQRLNNDLECKSCGNSYTEDSIPCFHCYSLTSRMCGNCGNSIPLWFHFCPEYGSKQG